MRPEQPESPEPRRSLLGPRLAAIALLVLGFIALYQVFQIRQGAGYSAVGTSFFPLVVVMGLIALSMVFLLRTTVLPDIALAEQAADEATKTHWPAVGWTGLALVLYALALNPLGYVLATSLFFPVVARILDSRKPGRDLIIGVGLSLVIYITFTRFLGVRLPAGLLGGIL